jgi:hypothetical protein
VCSRGRPGSGPSPASTALHPDVRSAGTRRGRAAPCRREPRQRAQAPRPPGESNWRHGCTREVGRRAVVLWHRKAVRQLAVIDAHGADLKICATTAE